MFIGIDVDENEQYVAVIKSKKDFNGLESATYSTKSANVKPLYTNFPSATLTSGISAKDSYIKKILIKADSTKNLKRAIAFQISSLALAQKNKTQISYHYANEDHTLFLASTRRVYLESHLKELNEHKIDPDIVSFEAFALANFSKLFLSIASDSLILNFKTKTSSYVLSKNGLPYLSGALLHDLSETFQECAKYKNCNLDSIKFEKKKNVQHELDNLKLELAQIIQSASIASKEFVIVLTGKNFLFTYLQKWIEDNFSYKVASYDQALSEKATAIGFAIAGALRKNDSIQLRVGSYTARKVNQRSSLLLNASSFAIFMASLILLIGGHFSINLQKKDFQKTLLSIIKNDPLLNKNISQEIFSAKNLLTSIEKEIVDAKKKSIYLKEPEVGQILDALNNHPLLADAKITGVKYALEKYPQNEEVSPFKARVSLDFKTKNMQSSKKFYESLLSGKDIADSNEEITWDVFDAQYHTSFYIKTDKLLKKL